MSVKIKTVLATVYDRLLRAYSIAENTGFISVEINTKAESHKYI